jgi:hypothetical protein
VGCSSNFSRRFSFSPVRAAACFPRSAGLRFLQERLQVFLSDFSVRPHPIRFSRPGTGLGSRLAFDLAARFLGLLLLFHFQRVCLTCSLARFRSPPAASAVRLLQRCVSTAKFSQSSLFLHEGPFFDSSFSCRTIPAPILVKSACRSGFLASGLRLPSWFLACVFISVSHNL